ncbi:hypothetical protein GRJ2_003281400 [Grus japonensis]|uniref:Uncharacterized protein n=1 Tax=Grus japonensis TaxID=30415 RepID=A0ABC9YF05_GRUJA
MQEEIHQDVLDTMEKFNSKQQKHYAQMKTWLQEDKQENEVVLKGLGENEWVPTGPGGVGREGGLEEGCSGFRDSDPSFSQVLRQELKKLEEALEQEETQILCLLLVGLQLAVGFALGAAVLYASSYDPELIYHLLPRVLCHETYTDLAYALGKILPVASEGLLPF